MSRSHLVSHLLRRVCLSLGLILTLGMASAKDAAVAVPEGVEFTQGITYGTADGQALLLDLAKPKTGTGPFPALVFVHGGGWTGGGRADYRNAMLPYAAHGIVCVSIDYRLTPKYQFPSQIEDVKCAVRWVRANAEKYHVDEKRIGAVGGSAGAHLVALLGATGSADTWNHSGGNDGQSSAIKMMVCHGIPADLLMGYEHAATQHQPEGEAARGMLKAFLGGTPETQKERYLASSPVTHVTKQTPPALLLHGVDDPLVLLEQAETMASTMEKAGASVRLIRIEGGGHGGFGKDAAKVIDQVNHFVKAQLLDR